jgi:hypothetical protein
MKRSAVIVAAGGLLLAGMVTLVMTPAGAATTGCRATYTVPSQWPAGFTANVAVTNLGDPVSHWVVTFDFAAGQQVTQGWNATWSQSGAHVSAANPGWGGPLGTGSTVNIGFNGSWTGSNPIPTAVFLDGTLCTGTVSSPSASPSGTASVSPSASSSGTDQPPAVRVTSPIAGRIYGEPGTLQLSANASDPDGTITKVEFYTGDSTGSLYTQVATVTTAPYSFTLTVPNVNVWYVRAIAYDNAGLTAADTVHISVAVSDPAPPGVPSLVQAAVVTESTVDLSWMSALAGSNPVAAYDIYTSANGQPYQLAASTTLVNRYYTLTGLTTGTSYRIVVRARDTAGVSGSPSNPISVSTGAAGTSAGPPIAIAATSTTVTVTWHAPTVNADKVTEYDIIIPALTPTAPVRLLGRVTGQVTTLTLTGLSPNTTYQAVVWALGVGTYSVRGTFSTTG